MAETFDNLELYSQTIAPAKCDSPAGDGVDDGTEATALEAEAASQHFMPNALKAYKDNSKEKISDEQIVDYLPMVQKIVNNVASYLKGPLSKEDLVSAGTIGLIKAAKDYDSTKQANFKTYAYIRVRGAVIDELRKWSFTPSEASKQIEQIRQVTIELNNSAGAVPDDEEIAKKVGITVNRLHKLYESARSQHFLSIHSLSDEAPSLGSSLASTGTNKPGDRIERKEMLELLTKSIQDLPEKSRRIIILYYHQELTMKEIAEVLDITESRVSQLHASAIFKLSVKMSLYDDTRED